MASSDDAGSGLTRYFATIRGRGLLTAERERELAREVRDGSLEARDRLIECNLAFVARIAGQYRQLGLPYEDLLNEGNIGLLEAAERFDPTRGVRFLTYAAWWIRKSILRAVSEHSSLVRVPETQVKVVREFRLEERRLRQLLGRRPSREEISHSIPTDTVRVDQLLRAAGRPLSLDQPAHGDSDARPLGEMLVDETAGTAADAVDLAQASARVLRAVASLATAKRTVIRHRFGLDGNPRLTLERVGRLLGVSRERVRQIETVALAELLRALRRSEKQGAPGAAGGGESLPRRRLRARLSSRDTRQPAKRLHPACKDV